MRFLLAIFLLFSCLLMAEDVEYGRFSVNERDLEEDPLMTEFPELKKFQFTEPKSNLYLGIGASPIALIGSKVFVSTSLFQAHYISQYWDIELISASVGQVITSNDFADSRHFTLRFAPKFIFMNIFETGTVSFGPMIGYESVRFPSIQAKKVKAIPAVGPDPFETQYDEFSTAGFIFGAVLSQTFTLRKDRKFKVSQFFYSQSYDVDRTAFDWRYQFQDERVNDPANKQEIVADSVFMLEFAYLF